MNKFCNNEFSFFSVWGKFFHLTIPFLHWMFFTTFRKLFIFSFAKCVLCPASYAITRILFYLKRQRKIVFPFWNFFCLNIRIFFIHFHRFGNFHLYLYAKFIFMRDERTDLVNTKRDYINFHIFQFNFVFFYHFFPLSILCFI